MLYTRYHCFEIGHKNIGQISPLPILLFAYMLIWQPCKHRHSESIKNKKIATLLTIQRCWSDRYCKQIDHKQTYRKLLNN